MNSSTSTMDNTPSVLTSEPWKSSMPKSHAQGRDKAIPTEAYIEQKWKAFYDNFKIISHSDCPAHPELGFCDCATAMAAYTAYQTYRTKVDGLFQGWEVKLLVPDSEAYDYDGTQESHQAFVSKSGLTPKQFALKFFREYPPMFAQSGKLKDLINAMVDFWVMRTALWKAKYKNREEAKEKWFNETYDESEHMELSVSGLKGLKVMEVGSGFYTHEVKFGPDGHKSTFSVLEPIIIKSPLSNEHGFVVKIGAEKFCHKGCPVARVAAEQQLRYYVKDLARSSGFGQVDISRVKYAPAAEMRAAYGLPKDDSANTKEPDVFYIV